MFAVGDKVVYGNNGICEVMDITQMSMPGADVRTYYVLAPAAKKESRVYSPVDNVKVVMRYLVTAEEANNILNQVKDIPCLDIVNDKMIENRYREILATCDIVNVIGMMKTIWEKQQKRIEAGKKITSTDDRYLKRAQHAVFAELSMALDTSSEEVEQRFKEAYV